MTLEKRQRDFSACKFRLKIMFSTFATISLKSFGPLVQPNESFVLEQLIKLIEKPLVVVKQSLKINENH